MAKQTKKQAPTSALRTKTAGKTPAYSGTPKGDYSADKGKPYGEKPANGKPYAGTEEKTDYDGKNIKTPAYNKEVAADVKKALYGFTAGGYNARGQHLGDVEKQDLREGIDGLVDAITRIKPELIYGLQAAVIAETAEKAGFGTKEGRHYLNSLASRLAEYAGLKAYEAPENKKQGGYEAFGGQGGMPPDLGQMLASYFGRGTEREEAYGKKTS